jgi:membrane-associated phospholipid phosphatase
VAGLNAIFTASTLVAASLLRSPAADAAPAAPASAISDTALAAPVAPPPPARSSMWRREWPTFSPLEGAATILAGAGTVVLFMLKPPSDPRWEGGILFDDSVRSGLRLESASARQKARTWGDVPYFAAPVIPLIIDPLIAAWLVRGDTKAAFNLGAIGLEAFSYAGLASFVSTRLSVRERPDSTECRRQGGDCESDTEAFYSGHTTIAAASAGIVCANHRVMPLWGSRVADVGACALATTGAVVTGVSRLMSDRHYTTDVIVGFGFGFGFGYAVPTLLHYAHRKTEVSLSLAPGGPCTAACLKLSGRF